MREKISKKLLIVAIILFISYISIMMNLNIAFSGPNDIWVSCCANGCDYKPPQSKTFGGKTYYCCDINGEVKWSENPCGCEVDETQSSVSVQTICNSNNENGASVKVSANIVTKNCNDGTSLTVSYTIFYVGGTEYVTVKNNKASFEKTVSGPLGCYPNTVVKIKVNDKTLYDGSVSLECKASSESAFSSFCSDNNDNDCDGKKDCEDPDCSNNNACSNKEICNDGKDNDGDNLVDCNDPDCSNDNACKCASSETSCNDNVDNDCDGKIDCNDPDCSNDNACKKEVKCSGTEFGSRCPYESTSFSLTCPSNSVCVYYVSGEVCDNTGKTSSTSAGPYCIDKKPPYFVDIQHRPELISTADNTYDPYPNVYYDMQGNAKSLTPDKVVIDKEYIEITSKSRDEYNGKELSGVSRSSLSFTASSERTKSKSFPVGSCPNGGLYTPPATHQEIFRNLNIGWGTVNTGISDQVGLSASNNNYRVYIFLGARGDQQNQRGTDKIVFLKTYWDSTNEVLSITQGLGGKSSKKINCFGYSNKCTQIRDIIGKTDEFTDCLWVGPSNNPRNVRIYNFKQAVDLDANEVLSSHYYKDLGNRVVFAWQDIAPVSKKIAFCSKNDTGILVDLPNLISRDIKNGFEILPSTEKRFSVIWQVEYAREQREVAAECYLNPTNDGFNACTIDQILNGNCQLESGQKCSCGNAFPCVQDTTKQTIQSCSVENPRYFTGTNRIICRFYDPRDKGIRAEVWFNHEFYYLNGKVVKANSKVFDVFILSLEDMLKSFIRLIKPL